MKFDFTNVSEAGFVTIPVGRYKVETGKWYYGVKEETGNVTFHVNAKILDGDYKDETIRGFQTVTQNERSKGFMLAMLSNLGITNDADRGPNGELEVEFVFGDKLENGLTEVKGCKVNNQPRAVEGRKGTAVVTHYKAEGSEEKRSKIDRFEKYRENEETTAPATTTNDTPW